MLPERRSSIRKGNDMKDKKMKKVSNIMLVISVLNILWFTIAAIILQFRVGIELSSTLITCWYAFWTCEIFALAGIKITKVRNEENESDDSKG